MEQYEKEHLESLRAYLAECTLFLKKDGRFPLEKAGKIALFGNGARHTIKGGTGSGEVNSRYFHTVEDGLREAGFTITTDKWLNAYDHLYKRAKETFKQGMRKEAKQAGENVITYSMGAIMPEPEYELAVDGEGDAAIYVLCRISGEGTDRKVSGGDFLLTNAEIRDINALSAKFERFMLVLNTGGPVDLTPVKDVQNILLLSQLGVETGDTLANILLGKANPSGKLATTWSAFEDYPAFSEFGGYHDTRYKEGIYVGYRYFDSVQKTPMFPFGFGLSYNDFELTDPSVRLNGKSVHISLKVNNIGAFTGKEVVQAYVSVPAKELDQPYQALASWCKTPMIEAGQSCSVDFSFDLSDIASYDAKKEAYVLEEGEYIIRIGNSSRSTVPAAVVTLAETVTLIQTKNLLGKPDFDDYRPSKSTEVIPDSVPRLSMDLSAFTTKKVAYDRTYEIVPAAKALSDEELVLLNIGYFNPQGGIASMVGNSGSKVAGAAGETAGVKDFPVMVMADGPAGVRVCSKFFRDEDGVHGLTSSLPISMVEFMPWYVRAFMKFQMKKPKKGTPVEYQYATAIPIGTAIAQSFNLEFAKLCGTIVGDEMTRIGIHLWLAPALNIHRSVLCGRNFEYYSEDPIISGKMAAGITLGVQKFPKCGVTIKHFAGNNQEYHRTSSNSQASERALREIYLKGFEICVKEAAPLSVMTSYNLINGVHTSEHRNLIDGILRNEWGFEGIVMTDWIINGGMIPKDAKYGSPKPYGVAGAGGDLYMPGSHKDYDDMLGGLKEGKLSREQLEINASRLYKMSHRLAD